MKYTAEQQTQNAIKWINALGSGRYKKTTMLLEYAGKYCCLGVACKVLRVPYDRAASAAPIQLQMKIGLKDKIGGFRHGSISNGGALTSLNDMVYGNDADFTNVHRDILLNPHKVFPRRVAKAVASHFAKEIEKLKSSHV